MRDCINARICYQDRVFKLQVLRLCSTLHRRHPAASVHRQRLDIDHFLRSFRPARMFVPNPGPRKGSRRRTSSICHRITHARRQAHARVRARAMTVQQRLHTISWVLRIGSTASFAHPSALVILQLLRMIVMMTSAIIAKRISRETNNVGAETRT